MKFPTGWANKIIMRTEIKMVILITSTAEERPLLIPNAVKLESTEKTRLIRVICEWLWLMSSASLIDDYDRL